MRLQIRKHQCNQGYTLVELLLYFVLSSLLFIQLTTLFITMLDAKSNIHSLTSIQRDGQYILARLNYDIKNADTIIEPVTLGQTSATIRLTVNGIEHIYQLSDGQLTLTRNGAEIALHDKTSVSEFSATRLGNVGGNHTLRLQFRVTSPITENRGNQSELYQTAVGVR